jgi:hypothetical protein
MSRSESAITWANLIMLLPSTTFSWTIWLCANLLAGFLARDCYEGIRTCDLWVSVLIWTYRRAIVGGTPEFPGQLIASLLVAQWLGHWCTRLVANVRFLVCVVQSQLLQGETWSCCCHIPHFHELHAYVLTCLHDSWPEITLKGFEPVTFGSVFWSEAKEGQ